MFLNSIFNWANFLSFLIGLGAGLVIFSLLYLLVVLLTLKDKKYIVSTKVNDVTDEEIKEIIKNSQIAFKDKNLKGEDSAIAYCTTLSKDLVVHIASRFFPESKHPVFELSIDELIMLCNYISSRVDEILGRRGLRIIKKIKISTIVGLSDVKKTIDENPIVKTTKKYKIYETLSAAKKVVNIVNPVWWARKLITDSILKVITNKLCVVILGIVGEETYKIYSKSVFNQDVTIDSGVSQLVDEIDNDIISSLEDEEKEEYTKKINEQKNDSKPSKGIFGLFKRNGV